MGVTETENPFLVTRIELIQQRSTVGTTDFEDDALVRYMALAISGHLTGKPLTPAQCMRVWIHTHPSDDVGPSGKDYNTLREKFSEQPRTIMMILGKNNTLGITRRYVVEGDAVESEQAKHDLFSLVDWSAEWTGMTEQDRKRWDEEYKTKVLPPQRTGNQNVHIFGSPGRVDLGDTPFGVGLYGSADDPDGDGRRILFPELAFEAMPKSRSTLVTTEAGTAAVDLTWSEVLQQHKWSVITAPTSERYQRAISPVMVRAMASAFSGLPIEQFPPDPTGQFVIGAMIHFPKNADASEMERLHRLLDAWGWGLYADVLMWDSKGGNGWMAMINADSCRPIELHTIQHWKSADKISFFMLDLRGVENDVYKYSESKHARFAALQLERLLLTPTAYKTAHEILLRGSQKPAAVTTKESTDGGDTSTTLSTRGVSQTPVSTDTATQGDTPKTDAPASRSDVRKDCNSRQGKQSRSGKASRSV